jgi:hypothetical protein
MGAHTLDAGTLSNEGNRTMSMTPLRGTTDGERRQRLFFQFYEQWSAFLHPGRMNWIDFSFIRLECEWDRHTGRVEIELRLLGLGGSVTYIYDHSFNDQMLKRIEEIKSERARSGEGTAQ